MTTEERLKQYIDNDEVYQDYKKGNINLTDFEKFCVQHCKDIEEILEENQKYKEVIDKLNNLNNRIIEEYKLNYGDNPSKLLLALNTISDILKEVE